MAAAEPGLRSLTRRVSLGGLMAALIVLSVIAAHLMPTANLALYALASLGLAICVIEIDLKTAAVVYLAATLVSLAYPGLSAAYPLLVFFGPYPLAKALLDKHFKRLAAKLLALACGNLLAVLAAVLFAWPAALELRGRAGIFFWPLLILGLQVILLIFDYALGLLIQFYMTRLRKI